MAVAEIKDLDWNWNMFINTVNMLANSQGFYSRLKRQVNEMSTEDIEQAKEQLSNLPKFNDTLDVVMWLEG